MPFNMAMLMAGRREFIIEISTGSSGISYNIANLVAAQYNGAITQSGDLIKLLLNTADDIIATNTSVYVIDAADLHDLATMQIDFVQAAKIYGKGGDGGKGGTFGAGGVAGSGGGTAIRLGCATIITGSGTIAGGGGGGGGGGGNTLGPINTRVGGGGGGGGASTGAGGAGGAGSGAAGSPGIAALITTGGVGGAAGSANGSVGGDGGAGGDLGENGLLGQVSGTAAGAGGVAGLAIETQGFSNNIGVGITVIGSVI